MAERRFSVDHASGDHAFVDHVFVDHVFVDRVFVDHKALYHKTGSYMKARIVLLKQFSASNKNDLHT